MSAPILNRRDIEFFLYEMFNVESLTNREKYQDHDRTTINGAIDTAQAIAEKYYIPIQHKVDANQPTFDYEMGGMQSALLILFLIGSC